jgi:hypothetical protein
LPGSIEKTDARKLCEPLRLALQGSLLIERARPVLS